MNSLNFRYRGDMLRNISEAIVGSLANIEVHKKVMTPVYLRADAPTVRKLARE